MWRGLESCDARHRQKRLDFIAFAGSLGNNAFRRPLISLKDFAVNEMSPDETKRAYRKDMLLASVLIMAGLAISGLSLVQIAVVDRQLAQATLPLQSSPTPTPQASPSAESKPGGERPTTPAPEPARPDAQAQKDGATPTLPAAPAEKMAPPIKDK